VNRTTVLLLVIFCSFATGCIPVSLASEPTPAPTMTMTPSPEPSPTATVVWFPPTATVTPPPTLEISPTPDLLPEYGEVLFEDRFEAGEEWSLVSTANGTIALGKDELTIVIPEEKAYMSTLRSRPVVSNFYAEISAGPTLCSGQDEYGLLLRAASLADFYRFSLSCDGQVRMDRVVSGKASSPQPWTMSGAYPPGAPSLSRIGVWASGSEMRFFINGIHQFTVKDPYLNSGNLGVFARSTGNHSLTVSFSDLVVYEIDRQPDD